jgi:RNA polymerase sigma-70 factor (ECF subfamily)
MLRQNGFEIELIALQPELDRYARSLAGDRAGADDLVQETLARALQHQDRFKPGTNLRAWTFTILRNCHHTQWHKDKRFAPWQEWLQDSRHTTPEQEPSIMLDETLARICALPEYQRNALILVGVGGCSYEEAAQLEHCPKGTMKSRVSRAREALTRSASPCKFSTADAAAVIARVMRRAMATAPRTAASGAGLF